MHRIQSRISLPILILTFLPTLANASLLSGTGGAPTWPNFLGPATIDFDSGPTGLFTSNTWGNVTFNGLDFAYNISPNYNGLYNTNGVNSLQSGQPTNPILPSKIEFVFTIPVSAVTFNWGAADNTWKLDAYDSSNTLLETHFITLPNSNVNNGEYYGIQNNTLVKRLLLVDQKDFYPLGDHIFIDDVTTSFESTPEPASLAILLTAASLTSLSRRRISRHVAL
jgi:hypothetical protein